MRGWHDLVRAFIEIRWKHLVDLTMLRPHSVMSFIGYDYKKNRESSEPRGPDTPPDVMLDD